MAVLRSHDRVGRRVKRGKVVGKRRARASQAVLKAADLHNPSRDINRATYLTTAEAADYLAFTARCKQPANAFIQFARDKRIVPARCGRVCLWLRRDLDETVQKDRQAALHSEMVTAGGARG